MAILDSQSVKTADGGVERGYAARKKVTGHKRHIFVDNWELVLLMLVTAGNVQDRDGAKLLFQARAGAHSGLVSFADLLGRWWLSGQFDRLGALPLWLDLADG